MIRGRPLIDVLPDEGRCSLDRSDQGRALAAQRPRDTFVCAMCGQSFEAWARKTQQARTCSPKCRVKLHRQEHRKTEAPMPKTSKWKAQHIGCQAAVDALRRDLTAEIERLAAENAELRAKVVSLADADSEDA